MTADPRSAIAAACTRPSPCLGYWLADCRDLAEARELVALATEAARMYRYERSGREAPLLLDRIGDHARPPGLGRIWSPINPLRPISPSMPA